VLLVSAYFRPHVGGVERFTETLASALAERGHEVAVLTCRTEPGTPSDEAATYRVRRVPATNVVERRLGVPYPLPAPRPLLRALREEIAAADVVHVQDVLYASSVAALLVAARRRRPSLVTVHVGFVPQRHRALELLERFAISLAAPAARSAGQLVAYNPAVAAWARRTWSVDADVVPVGVEPSLARADREGFGLPHDRLVALFVGRDVAKKGLDAFAAVQAREWLLVAVTDGRRPGVRTVPFMAPERFASLLASADALVLPSRGEGIPLVIQEAMAAGVPVAATMEPGYERYLDEDDIVAIDPDPASISRALDRLRDPDLRRALADRGRGVAARHFSAHAMADAYERLYARLSP
jgi:glycosyltransferase involved in cell wall biosynthesis